MTRRTDKSHGVKPQRRHRSLPVVTTMLQEEDVEECEDPEFLEDVQDDGQVHMAFDKHKLEESDEDEEDIDSSSSFSLQECINEFRARRIRRISTHSRDIAIEECETRTGGVHTKGGGDAGCHGDDEDLINQNRSNKEQERKCKPCQNGFCYCFTSDSGDGGCSAARGVHVRQTRRSRRSESSQVSYLLPQRTNNIKPKELRRQSAPANLKAPPPKPEQVKCRASTKVEQEHKQLTAISSLRTSTKDAPLIHIIQELRDNCVISEVRVNKDKMQTQHIKAIEPKQRSRSLNGMSEKCWSSPKKSVINDVKSQKNTSPKCSSNVPTLQKIREHDTAQESSSNESACAADMEKSIKCAENLQRRSKAAGRLLQKRLSNTQTNFKPRNFSEPPPKPPRCSATSLEDKGSISTINSTTTSVRAAERVVDEFLRKKGVVLPSVKQPISSKSHWVEKRKSYPLIQTKQKSIYPRAEHLPTCPSLSDIERVVESKKGSNYAKNICQAPKINAAEKPYKEVTLGWTEPKIRDMLNYETAPIKRQFKSQATQAEPQSLAWQVPNKISLDTVDGSVRRNLAANIEEKNTPVKSPTVTNNNNNKHNANDSQKFIWGEQLRNLSPWNARTRATSARKPIKSSLKSATSTRNFLNNSKKKILRLVSPKKDNKTRSDFAPRKTPLRTVGVQTSREDLRYEPSITPQSPPGSYHSPVQSTSATTMTPTQNDESLVETGKHFDFSRQVHSPQLPKKTPRMRARKLDFPLDCSAAATSCLTRRDSELNGEQTHRDATKTYRSFQTDLDSDVTLSKMGYILSNIRAKLEAGDNHACRTFREVERRDLAASVDCTDGHIIRRLRENHNNREQLQHNEPIYSEIEEESIHISGSPQFDNKTGAAGIPVPVDTEVLYAKVNKPRKTKIGRATPIPPTPLGKFLQDSMKLRSLNTIQFPPLPEPPSSDVSYSSPAPSEPQTTTTNIVPNTISHCYSLNNIHEKHSPPKNNRNLSKSDLSLHRSEIFLENLCNSEIIIERDGEFERLEKVDNHTLSQTYFSLQDTAAENMYSTTDDDTVSYELPPETYAPAEDDDVDTDYATAGSNLGLSIIDPPQSQNQSTPKKRTRTFMTKHSNQDLSIEISNHDILLHNQSNSCPTTPQQQQQHQLPTTSTNIQIVERMHAQSLSEFYTTANSNNGSNNNNNNSNNNILTISALARYERLKNALRKSYKKSKNFLKSEKNRLSLPSAAATSDAVHQMKSNQNDVAVGNSSCSMASSLNLESLFTVDENLPTAEQLVQAVTICRNLPEFEISPEMVEAERLLLCSTLRRKTKQQQQQQQTKLHFSLKQPQIQQQQQQRTHSYFIDAMHLPVQANPSQDIFFNYFYICTFECDGVISSTQSAECHNREAIFRDCGIEFRCNPINDELEIRCQIFMLRLRKVSTLSLEPQKSIEKLQRSTSSSNSSNDEIVSRFRLHASFTLKAQDFVPYDYVASESRNCDKICLRSSSSWPITLTTHTKSTNLATVIQLTGRAEVRLPKHKHSGFLNVQDPNTLHNWNRRWCTLDALHVFIWQDSSDMSDEPLLCLDLRHSLDLNVSPLCAAPRELCARPRSFCLQCATLSPKVGTVTDVQNVREKSTSAVFFAADTQSDLVVWLQQLNVALTFINNWLQ